MKAFCPNCKRQVELEVRTAGRKFRDSRYSSNWYACSECGVPADVKPIYVKGEGNTVHRVEFRVAPDGDGGAA